MSLKDAFRHKPGESLAFVGAGGKTTAIFNLAHEIQPPVLVTTTTHLGLNQLPLADQVIRLDKSINVGELFTDLELGIVLLVGAQAEDQRVSGIGMSELNQVFLQARQQRVSMLIEADGSRLKPAKAPAEHEPHIPPFVQGVVVLLGLSVVDKPLTGEWVHRVGRFSEISGLSEGEKISPDSIIKVLLHPEGGLKGIPSNARRYCFLNQADNPQLESLANRISRSVIPTYDACIIASLQGETFREGMWTGFVAENQTEKRKICAVHESIYGIILAAGGSDRMGQIKQLLPWRGEPLVRHVARAAISAGLSSVIAVVGAADDKVKDVLLDLPVEIVKNPDWDRGQSTSLLVGLSNLPRGAGGAIFFLADQPLVSAPLIRAITEKRAITMSPIVMPVVDGQRGNPVLFGWQTFDDLRSIRGDQGGRAIFPKYPIEQVEWYDSSVLSDVDTPEDYQRLLSMDD